MSFSFKVHILGHQRDEAGNRSSKDKLGMFREWPLPKTKEELLKFTYMLPFLRNYIPVRADLTTTLRVYGFIRLFVALLLLRKIATNDGLLSSQARSPFANRESTKGKLLGCGRTYETYVYTR